MGVGVDAAELRQAVGVVGVEVGGGPVLGALGAGEAMSTSMVTHNEGVGIPHEVEGVRMGGGAGSYREDTRIKVFMTPTRSIRAWCVSVCRLFIYTCMVGMVGMV